MDEQVNVLTHHVWMCWCGCELMYARIFGCGKLSIMATQLLCLMLVLGFAGKKRMKNDCGTDFGSRAVYTPGRA